MKKSAHPASKAKVLYRLTQKGIDLLPIIMEIYIWSEKHFPASADLKAKIEEVKKDKDKFIREVSEALKAD